VYQGVSCYGSCLQLLFIQFGNVCLGSSEGVLFLRWKHLWGGLTLVLKIVGDGVTGSAIGQLRRTTSVHRL
jgi:hypothetical protein